MTSILRKVWLDFDFILIVLLGRQLADVPRGLLSKYRGGRPIIKSLKICR